MIVATPETGAKIMRAMPAATQMDAGNLTMVAAPWNDNFLASSGVSGCAKDDQVDALSRAVNTLGDVDGPDSPADEYAFARPIG